MGRMAALLVLLALGAPPTLELSLDRGGTPEAGLWVRVRNGAGHRPIGLLREFWKHQAIACTLRRDGEVVPLAFALRPDRPTLAQIVILEPLAEYGERLGLGQVWGPAGLLPGSYHAECHPGTRAEAVKLYEASIAGAARRASAGLIQDLRRVDLSLADVRAATLDFTVQRPPVPAAAPAGR